MARTRKDKPGVGKGDVKHAKQTGEKAAQQQNASQNGKAPHKSGNGEPPPTKAPEQLYGDALEALEQSMPAKALKDAQNLWNCVQTRSITEQLPALNLLGEISVELGDVDSARNYFTQAVNLDPDGAIPETSGGGAEKFLWLAQLSEEGGKESVQWFEKGAKALQAEITALDNGTITILDEEAFMLMRVEKKRKLANALCGIVEVYMTDLSWEDDAETRCETLVTQAMSVEDEPSPEVLQTLASVRLSQERKEDARAALTQSLAHWKDHDPEGLAVPDFPTRISLSRLLMEAGMEEDAMHVVQRLITDDDQSVEAWYLGGWCQHLIAAKLEVSAEGSTNSDTAMNGSYSDYDRAMSVLRGSRYWLNMALRLYKQQDYEDERLFDHAEELVDELHGILGPEVKDAEGGEEHWDEWKVVDGDSGDEDEDEDADDDEEMEGVHVADGEDLPMQLS